MSGDAMHGVVGRKDAVYIELARELATRLGVVVLPPNDARVAAPSACTTVMPTAVVR